jgi:hypothetical protein
MRGGTEDQSGTVALLGGASGAAAAAEAILVMRVTREARRKSLRGTKNERAFSTSPLGREPGATVAARKRVFPPTTIP